MSVQPSRKKMKTYNLRCTSTKLLELNDDCLLKILGLLHPKDLFETANVCKRLQTLARDHFSRKCKNYVLANCASFRNHHQRVPCIQAGNLLRNFGRCFRKINLCHIDRIIGRPTFPTFMHKRQKMLKLQRIIKFCTNLVDVTICGLAINFKDIEMWKSLFANISALSIKDCQLVDVTMIFILSLCPKLKCLEIDVLIEANFGTSLMFVETLPTDLEEITLNYCSLRHLELTRLIESNIRLRKLHVTKYFFVDSIIVKQIQRLVRFQNFKVEPMIPRISAPTCSWYEFIYLELDNNDDDSDELDYGAICSDRDG